MMVTACGAGRRYRRLSERRLTCSKKKRFSKGDREIPICKNEAFLLNDESGRASFKQRYAATATLYYNGQPAFEDIMARIRQHVDKL